MKKQQINEDIIVDPKVRFGKPVIAGTRVPVDLIVGKIASGMTLDAVEKEYELTHGQVLAALCYGAGIWDTFLTTGWRLQARGIA